MMRRIERENTGLLHPGQDLVVAGYAGLAGTLKLVETKIICFWILLSVRRRTAF